VVEAGDAETAVPRAERAAGRERERRLGLRIAELERRLEMPALIRGRRARRSGSGRKRRGGAAAGAPHVLIVRTPDGRLTWLAALASRRKGDVADAIGPRGLQSWAGDIIAVLREAHHAVEVA
jgi:hypothetical protein